MSDAFVEDNRALWKQRLEALRPKVLRLFVGEPDAFSVHESQEHTAMQDLEFIEYVPAPRERLDLDAEEYAYARSRNLLTCSAPVIRARMIADWQGDA